MTTDYLLYQSVCYDRVVVEPPTRPEPAALPALGKRTRGRIVRTVHDDLNIYWGGAARTLLSDKIQGSITNELLNARRWYLRDDGVWRVDQYSKISYYPEALSPAWFAHFFSGMSARQHESFDLSSFGWRDGKADTESLHPFNLLITAGSSLERAGAWREWTLFHTQDTDRPPDTGLNIWSDPTRWFVQGVCGHNADKQSFYGSINQGQGRLAIPNASPGGIAAIETANVREFPSLPFETTINGYPMRFVEYFLTAADVLGLDELTGNWYYVEKQAGDAGNASDMVVYVPLDDWIPVRPVPVVERQKV